MKLYSVQAKQFPPRGNASGYTSVDIPPDGIAMRHYAIARYAGATNEEILAAHAAGVHLWDYAAARREGVPHDLALASITQSDGE